jgi:hypothetical protein
MTTMPRVAMLQRVSSSTSRPPEPMRDPQPWSQRRAGGVVSGAGRVGVLRSSVEWPPPCVGHRQAYQGADRMVRVAFGRGQRGERPPRWRTIWAAVGCWPMSPRVEGKRSLARLVRTYRETRPGVRSSRATGGSSARRRPRRQVSVATRARRIIARSIWAAVGPLSRRTRRAPRAVPSPSTTCRPITRVTGTTDPYGLWGRFRCMAFYRQSLPASYIAAGLR